MDLHDLHVHLVANKKKNVNANRTIDRFVYLEWGPHFRRGHNFAVLHIFVVKMQFRGTNGKKMIEKHDFTFRVMKSLLGFSNMKICLIGVIHASVIRQILGGAFVLSVVS